MNSVKQDSIWRVLVKKTLPKSADVTTMVEQPQATMFVSNKFRQLCSRNVYIDEDDT